MNRVLCGAFVIMISPVFFHVVDDLSLQLSGWMIGCVKSAVRTRGWQFTVISLRGLIFVYACCVCRTYGLDYSLYLAYIMYWRAVDLTRLQHLYPSLSISCGLSCMCHRVRTWCMLVCASS